MAKFKIEEAVGLSIHKIYLESQRYFDKYLIILMSLLIYLCPEDAFTQVSNVNYQLKYNADSCWYDVFIIINSGNAVSVSERTQNFSKFSIVVPTGTNISVIKNYNPIKGNASYSGTIPNEWIIYAAIGAPISDPISDYYIFSPSGDNDSHYYNLNTSDTIKLFSFQVDAIYDCGDGIRIFRNGIDPGTNAPGMGFIDFRNDFNLLSGTGLYATNSPTQSPARPLIPDAIVTCFDGIEIDISASSKFCQLPLNFRWYGPNNYTSTTEDVLISQASVTNSGIYKVIVSDVFGCEDSLNIMAENKPNAGNDMVICANTTIQLLGSDPTDGLWEQHSENNPGAILVNLSSGIASVTFNQITSGTYDFIYSTGVCADTMEVTVYALPSLNIVGSDSLCKGQATQLSPNTGGLWVSSNPTVATVVPNGLVTSLSHGNVNFTFTEILSGCPATTDDIIVHPLPVVSISGTPDVCVGSTTNILPNSGGIWISNSAFIATVDNSGLATGIGTGQTYFTYTDNATSCISEHLNIIVKAKPEVNITGPNSICRNATTQLTPSTDGTWESLQPSVATINSMGKVTAISPGTATFRWTETSTGCKSDKTDIVTVVTAPVITMSTNNICSGKFTLLTANAAGTWVSGNLAIATILPNSGLVTGISQGKVTLNFVRTSDFCVSVSDTLTINPNPNISSGTANLCVGSTTNLNPNTGGVWSSLDEDIISISGSTAMGLNQGFVTIRYIETASGCENNLLMHVSERAQANISDSDNICVGLSTQLSPTSGGIWTSNNNSIATVTNDGLVTGISEGSTTFIFTENVSGCNSQPTNPVMIKGLPVVVITGLDSICIGASTTLTSSGFGTWVSSNLLVATTNSSSGVTTGIGSGFATITYTESVTGCTSLPSQPITVKGPPFVSISGPSIICAGSYSQLSPQTGGTWSSNSPSIALVNNSGIVTSLSSGTVNFTYTQLSQGCNYQVTTGNLTITACFNPDFNITYSDVSVPGNLSTNDLNPTSNIYNNTYNLISGPLGGIPVLNINPDGSYTFEADVEGIYTLEIPVCVLPAVTGCSSSVLVITVKNADLPTKIITANIDLVSTSLNTPVIIKTLHNDACITIGGCSPDPATVAIINPPVSGNTAINSLNGNITFTPSSGYSGIVILTYKVCVTGESTNCDTSQQIITVLAPSPENSLTVCDDLSIGYKGTLLTGNILINDTDPEGNSLIASPQNMSGAYGTFQLNSNGSFSFMPSSIFTGPIKFIYEVCDNHTNQVCKTGTLYILVLFELTVNIRVYLEGALMNNTNAMAEGRPLMRDNLRMSPFTGSRYIPASDPYKIPTLYVNLESQYIHRNTGNRTEFESIPNPTAVFSVSGRDAIVDWVFIELRSKNNKSLVTATRSALLQRDGDVVDIDGISTLRFPQTAIDSYYVAVRHRNHLGAMTDTPQSPEQLNDLINFTSPTTLTFDFGTSKNNGYDYTGMAQKATVKSDFMALWAGDFDGNKKVKSENPNDDLNFLLFDVLFYPTNLSGNANFDFALGYFQSDFDLNSKAKFDNPNDDKNMLYAQLLFYPPNVFFLSNFDFFIEQLP